MIWGLIGASTIAAQHMIAAIRATGGTIGWVVSGTADHSARYAQIHGIPRHGTDLGAMLADHSVAAVYISSTNDKHFAQSMTAIAAGKHVLCEKPLAMTLPQARQMVQAAAAAGLTFATNHHLRCAGSHHAIRDLIAHGRIGRVLSARLFHAVHLPPALQGWRINDAGAGGGVIADICVHDADTLRFLLGQTPVDVVATAVSSGMGTGVEDSVMWTATLPSGVQVMAHESFTHPYAGSGLEVHGSEGSIFAQGVMTQNPVGRVELVTALGREAVAYAPHNLYEYGVGRFGDATRGKGLPAATGADGIASLQVAQAVRQAAQTGMRVQIADI